MVAHVPIVRPVHIKLKQEMPCAPIVLRENTLVQRLPLPRRHVPAVRIFLAVRVLHVLHLPRVLATLDTLDRTRARARDVCPGNTKLNSERPHASLVHSIQFRPPTARHLLHVCATLAIPDPPEAHVRDAPPAHTKVNLQWGHARLVPQDHTRQVLVPRRVPVVRRTHFLRSLDIRLSAAARATRAIRGQISTVQRVWLQHSNLQPGVQRACRVPCPQARHAVDAPL